jgi:homoserine kinase type II
MTKEEKERWAAEIAVHLKDRLGLSVSEVVPIDKGWLNVKWKMVTDNGPLFVKYYHPKRYKLHTRLERRSAIEKTLQLQHGLSVAGIPCPRVYLYNEQHIQQTSSGLFYTVLDWVDGHTAQAGCLNGAQMFELGVATGRMHMWLRSVPPLVKPTWKPDMDAYMREWQGNWEKAQEAGDITVMEWLRRSKVIVKSMDFRIFEPCPTGWLHWDLWVDNILLHEQGLAAIVDFDRMTMAYQEIDVARAVLSGSLQDGQMRMETARAFMDGYREHSEVPQGMLTRAMSMLYLIESIWWLRTEVRIESELRGLLGRFVEEMHWIEDNWVTMSDQLDTI